jgi:BRCA1-associated protein
MNMYSLRIEAQQRRAAEIDMRARQELSSQRHSEKEAEEPDELIGAELPEGAESVEFSVGNPRVEHITGVVHLYRELQQGHVSTGTGGPRSDQQASQANVPANSSTAAAAAAGQVQGGTTVPVEVAPSGRALPVGTPALRTHGDMSHPCCVLCVLKSLLLSLWWLQSGRTPLLCCLAIPGDMSVADFCVFCGAYLPAIRSMRVLRREARQRVVCMVLIR